RQQPEPLPEQGPSGTLGLWRRRLVWRRKIPAHCCDAIIFNSNRVSESYAFHYGWPARHFHVIPNGERACNLLRPYCGPAQTIAAVGRVSEAKGADTLMESFSLLAKKHPSIKLTYYGDGSLIPRLKDRAAAFGVAARVSFAGYRRWPE